MRQALEASRMATDDESKQEEILRKVALELSKVRFDSVPPEIAHVVHSVVREVSGNEDPYSELKKKYNQIAMEMYPDLKRRVEKSEDRLLTAAKIAIAGNIIDFGPGHFFDLNETIEETLRMDLAVNHFDKFKSELEKSNTIYYLGDNAGEIVFDRILLEELGDRQFVYVVKGGPIINDATEKDAKFAGINKIAKIEKVSSGALGTGPERNSKEFVDILKSADLVISKGQGNYESLSEADANIFFMFRAKCPVLAKDAGVDVGSTVIMKTSEK